MLQEIEPSFSDLGFYENLHYEWRIKLLEMKICTEDEDDWSWTTGRNEEDEDGDGEDEVMNKVERMI